MKAEKKEVKTSGSYAGRTINYDVCAGLNKVDFVKMFKGKMKEKILEKAWDDIQKFKGKPKAQTN